MTNVISSSQHGTVDVINLSPDPQDSRKLEIMTFEQAIIPSLLVMIVALILLCCTMAWVLHHKTIECCGLLIEKERTLAKLDSLRVDHMLERETLPRTQRADDLNGQTLWIAPYRGLKYHRSHYCRHLKSVKEARMLSPCSCMFDPKGQ